MGSDQSHLRAIIETFRIFENIISIHQMICPLHLDMFLQPVSSNLRLR